MPSIVREVADHDVFVVAPAVRDGRHRVVILIRQLVTETSAWVWYVHERTPGYHSRERKSSAHLYSTFRFAHVGGKIWKYEGATGCRTASKLSLDQASEASLISTSCPLWSPVFAE